MITIVPSASPNFTSSLDVPIRSERVAELKHSEVIQALIDNTEYLRLRTAGAADSRIIWVPIHQHVSAASDWTTTCSDYPYLLAGAGSMFTGYSVRCYWHLSPLLPSSGNLVSHGVYLKGAAGHAYPIQYPPVLTTIRMNNFAFPPTADETWSTTDDGTGVAYESVHVMAHAITTPIAIEAGKDIWMALANESGTNSEVNLTVLGAYVEVAP